MSYFSDDRRLGDISFYFQKRLTVEGRVRVAGEIQVDSEDNFTCAGAGAGIVFGEL